MGKSEDTTKSASADVKIEIPQPNQEVALLKSELEAEKAKAAELKKNFDGVQEFLTKLLAKKSAPQGKAITELAVIAKNEDAGSGEQPTLSKAEVTQILLKKSSDPKLEKNDREAINAFYASGQTNFNAISHLLK